MYTADCMSNIEVENDRFSVKVENFRLRINFQLRLIACPLITQISSLSISMRMFLFSEGAFNNCWQEFQ